MRVNMIKRFWPCAELLAIVGEDDGRSRPALGQAAEELVGGVRLLERDRVAEGFGARENLQQAALVLGEVVAKEVVAGDSRVLEMKVVEDCVFDASLGDGRDQMLLPDSLGHPHTA